MGEIDSILYRKNSEETATIQVGVPFTTSRRMYVVDRIEAIGEGFHLKNSERQTFAIINARYVGAIYFNVD